MSDVTNAEGMPPVDRPKLSKKSPHAPTPSVVRQQPGTNAEKQDRLVATQLQEVRQRIQIQQAGEAKRPEPSQRETTVPPDGTDKRETKPFVFKTTDGKVFNIALPANHTSEDMKKALVETGIIRADEVDRITIVPHYEPTISRFLNIVAERITRPFRKPLAEMTKTDETSEGTGHDVATEDGRRFRIQLPRNPTVEDVKNAFRAAGAKDLAERLGYLTPTAQRGNVRHMIQDILQSLSRKPPEHKDTQHDQVPENATQK